MAVSYQRKEAMYRAYMEFFELAEKKRRWNIWDDIPWDDLDPRLNNEGDAMRLETYCGVELYLPDYIAEGVNISREIFGQAWFAANWAYEESKHALVFREYLVRSGLRTTEEYMKFEESVLEQRWQSRTITLRQTTIYGAFQELLTYHIYRKQYDRAKLAENTVLMRVMELIARDEAAHCGFYRKIVQYELDDDRDGATEDIVSVLGSFSMPGSDIMPNYQDRLATPDAGLTREQFMRHIIFPTLKTFGVTRGDIARIQSAKAERA
ncbi:acyl-ACP desaturase [Sphingobium subterraneum]|uniref:Acyl-[acyl-carrier-protein] desaturase n=1 Tax=Sphingobium subterraneum TaxID=627688 RepID=A0A841IWX1_9SPHN|nr:acyl-ACP desaturase [Sphingobium subterraneum]MBB6122874.1 acyl-[acyl-carrier-protein] desaturase [Sphingobium subterraneum]